MGLLLLLPLLFPPSSISQEKKEFNLNEITQIGLKNNLSLLAEAKEVEARKAGFEASKPLFNPELEFHMGKGTVHETGFSRATDGISLSQSLENPLKRKYRLQMAENDWRAAEYRYLALKTAVLFDMKLLFHKILLYQDEIEFARKSVASLEEIHQLIEKRAKLGEVKELESVKLYVETLKARNELTQLQTELELAREELNRNLGNILPQGFSLQGKLEYFSPQVEEKALLEKALRSHPLIRNREAERDFSESRLNYVRWQRFPDPKLSGFLQNELHGKNQGVGVSLEIPLWNFRSKEIAEARYLHEKKQTELSALRMEVSTEVRARISRLRLSEATIMLFEGGLLKQADLSLRISEVSYRQGEISLLEYLDSQRTHYSILKDYQSSLFQWNADKFALEKSIGAEL